MASERDEAPQRLDAALVERHGLAEDWRAAIGTPYESAAHARLRVTSEEVAVLESWLGEPSEDRDAAGGRVWLNGHEVGRRGSRYLGLEDSHD